MELKSLSCPNCGATLEIMDNIDTFFCKYCGHTVLLNGQSSTAYEAKVRVKHMEHKEKLQDKHYAQERYLTEAKRKDEKNSTILLFSIFGIILIIILCITIFGNISVKLQEKELQAIVDEIMIDIENEDFTAAYVKANSLYWDDDWTSEGEDKWNATRKEIIKQIEEAEKKAKSKEKENKKGFFNWFD